MTVTSPAGRAAITQREGYKLTAYRDSVGIWTVGVGHTGRMSPPLVHMGMTITHEQCDDFLAGDLTPVDNAISSFVKVPLCQAERDALASLAFNIGIYGFQGSTVLRKLNKGDRSGAADAFLMWETPRVLKGRREAERAQFLSGSHDVPQLATAHVQPVLNGIFSRINAAAYPPAAVPALHGPMWVQAALNRLGASPKLVVDGQLGPHTQAALAPWQFNQHLPATGKADPATIAALEHALAALPAA